MKYSRRYKNTSIENQNCQVRVKVLLNSNRIRLQIGCLTFTISAIWWLLQYNIYDYRLHLKGSSLNINKSCTFNIWIEYDFQHSPSNRILNVLKNILKFDRLCRLRRVVIYKMIGIPMQWVVRITRVFEDFLVSSSESVTAK